jgi:hypothetical protein
MYPYACILGACDSVRVLAYVWVGGCTKRDTKCKLELQHGSPLFAIRLSKAVEGDQLGDQRLDIVMVVYQRNVWSVFAGTQTVRKSRTT